tara:strand:- start:1336 stop:1752 length:417 start_codon:yes stop_codon:yes gene_type:complete
MMEKIRIGMIGSKKFENVRKIKDFLFLLKNKYKNTSDVTIVTGGYKYGADNHIKKIALEWGFGFESIPTFHDQHNMYVPDELPAHKFGKPWNIRNFYARNRLIANRSDMVVLFGKGERISDSIIEYAKKKNKKYTIIS